MERGHYDGYRGRSGVQKVLTAIVAILAVLVVLMSLVLLLGQRYIYYGADGVHLDLPFLTREPAPPPDVDQVVVEVLPPAPKPEETEETEQIPGDVSGVEESSTAEEAETSTEEVEE